MSLVIAEPEMMAAAASDLASTGSNITAAHLGGGASNPRGDSCGCR
jgi:hypothetical protein